MLIYKILLCMMTFFSWLTLTEVFAVTCGLGVVAKAWVSHNDDQLWFISLYREEIWFVQHISPAVTPSRYNSKKYLMGKRHAERRKEGKDERKARRPFSERERQIRTHSRDGIIHMNTSISQEFNHSYKSKLIPVNHFKVLVNFRH